MQLLGTDAQLSTLTRDRAVEGSAVDVDVEMVADDGDRPALAPLLARGQRRHQLVVDGPHDRRRTRARPARLGQLVEKLARAGLIRASETTEPAAGPERSTFETTAKGRAALAGALEREEWTKQRERPPFLTWIALSWQARPGVFQLQLERRREFLEEQVAREKEVLASILEEVGHPYHEAVWMVSLVIEQFKLEQRWLRKLKRELPLRRPAEKPSYATSDLV